MTNFLKATDGERWYISIDGENFELCQREPFLRDKLAADADSVPVNNPAGVREEDVTLTKQQLEERGFSISQVTA